MKKTVAVWTLSALFSMAFLTACSSSSEKLDEAKEEVTEANEKLEEAQETYLSDIEEYKKETAAKIAANEQMIDDLEKANSVQYKGKVAELKAENELMKIKMSIGLTFRHILIIQDKISFSQLPQKTYLIN